METKTETLLDTLTKIKCIEVFSFHAYNYLAPRMSDYKFEGDTKFAKAFAHITTNSGNHFIYITDKDESGWNFRREITAYEFAKLLGIEMLSVGLKKFTASMFANANGMGKDAEATIADNSKEVYACYESGEYFWKNMVAQEQDIADAKARKSAYEEAVKRYAESKRASDEENIALDS